MFRSGLLSIIRRYLVYVLRLKKASFTIALPDSSVFLGVTDVNLTSFRSLVWFERGTFRDTNHTPLK
jgi:hypothetical protein